MINISKFYKNPRAGLKEYYIPSINSYSYVTNKEYIEYQKYLVNISNVGYYTYSSSQLLEILHSDIIQFEANYGFTKIYSLQPEPEYIIEYENKLIKCHYCDKEQEFDIKRYYPSNYYNSNQYKCIFCNINMNLEIETLEQAKERGLQCYISQ